MSYQSRIKDGWESQPVFHHDGYWWVYAKRPATESVPARKPLPPLKAKVAVS